MAAPEVIFSLVDRFQRNIDAYRSGNYNETQVRREFIDPFFKALGWDIDNEKGYAEAYKDVIHEYSLKTKDVKEAPDYCFRIGGTRKFFVEAKKPSVNLKIDIHPSFQLRSYAWSAKLPLSILTDFEEFAVYDARIPPKKTDKASTARVMYLTYKDYADKWDEIEEIFSREEVLKGSFDKYVESTKKKRGTAEVDEVFLKQMEEWRKLIAKNIALRNPSLTVRELNFAVQKTIDRIIFLRICEDRGIEDYGQLMSLQNGTNCYKRLKQIYYRADEKYNSGLFHFEKEKDRNEPPDELTLNLSIDDKIIKDIIKELYYPDSPYEFSVLPADILGQAYEQFLGKVIRLTPAHYAVIEDKPEVKKAGGVYYTPTYIVDYIVQNTLGKILNSPSFNLKSGSSKAVDSLTRKVSKLKILDPACGSGGFLLSAYQYLLDWHIKHYTSSAETIKKALSKKQPAIYEAGKNEYRLTTAEKKRILLNNIYGVDIDPQAVEVTKLSLLLKVLEGETEETINSQLKIFRERALPDLSNNIKCGNSLIGPDFYDQMKMHFLDEEEKLRINVFDWNAEFKDIMNNGGFGVVIGNPPYIRIQGRDDNEKDYLNENYISATGNYDVYCLFVERGNELVKKNGCFSYIIPHRFFKSDYGIGLRKYILEKQCLAQITDFDGYMVFKNSSINTTILELNNTTDKEFVYKRIKIHNLKEKEISSVINESNKSIITQTYYSDQLKLNTLKEAPWIFILNYEISLWKKLNRIKTTLGTVATEIFQGLKTGSDGYYIGELVKETKNHKTIHLKGPDETVKIERKILFPLIKGGHIKRYLIGDTDKYIIFPYKQGKLISEKSFENQYPLAWKYLKSHKDFLCNRENGKMKGNHWYGFTRSQALLNIFNKKIITPDYYAHASYALDDQGKYMFCGGGAGGYGIILNNHDYKFVLALLNSRLIDWYLKKISMRAYQTAYMYVKKYISQLPIITSKSNNLNKYKDDIEELSDQMIKLNIKLGSVKTPQDGAALQRQIDAADKQIDKLVYQLYGLTEEEIKIIEANERTF